MYFVATLHPHLPETEKKGYAGSWLSRREKEEQISKFYASGAKIPLCIDHRDVADFGFVYPEDAVGRVLALYTNTRHDLMVKCMLDKKHPEYGTIQRNIHIDKELWGVSVGLALRDRAADGTPNRQLVHVALTSDPGFAAHNTHIHQWAMSESAIDKAIASDGISFVDPAYMRVLEGYGVRNTMSEDREMSAAGGETAETKTGSVGAPQTGGGPPLDMDVEKGDGVDQLIVLREHMAAYHEQMKKEGKNLQDMSDEFKLRYFKMLEKKTGKTKELVALSVKLKAEGLDDVSGAAGVAVMTSNDPEALPLQRTMLNWAGANNRRYERSELENIRLASENRQMTAKLVDLKREREHEHDPSVSQSTAAPNQKKPRAEFANTAQSVEPSGVAGTPLRQKYADKFFPSEWHSPAYIPHQSNEAIPTGDYSQIYASFNALVTEGCNSKGF